MKSDKTLAERLQELQKDKGKICISIIVPTHRLSPERRGDRPVMEDAIDSARKFLTYNYSETDITPLVQKMDELLDKINYTHNAQGLGLYVSESISFTEQFPFPVEKKVMVGNNFEIRDILYKANFSVPYFVLLLTEKGTRLFEGRWNTLNEVNDEHFPRRYEELYTYEHPARSTSYAGSAHVKSFEKDKSELQSIRFKRFFRLADRSLGNYINVHIPLILAGIQKEMAWFESISDYKKNIIGKIAGSYNRTDENQLGDISWPLMLEHLNDERKKMLEEFTEKIGEGHGVNGIEKVWEAAHEGKALKLIVEKDFRLPGFTDREERELFLRPPQQAHHAIADAVDDIIETVLKKKGDVFFTDNGILQDYQRIALITRY